MAIKTSYFKKPYISKYPLICYKIVRKTYAYKHYVENGEDVDRFHVIYETILQSYDVSEYVNNPSLYNVWNIPEGITEEIEYKKVFGFIPKCKIIKEGYIFSYDHAGIIEYVKSLKQHKAMYGNDHFYNDLRIFKCEIPIDTEFYDGDNNNLPAYASKSLRFIEDVTDNFI